MKQAVMVLPGQIVFKEVPIPEITEEQVLIRIMRIGVCGSDIHVYHGEHPYTSYPVVQGHEVSGEIALVGKNVTDLMQGDRVTIQPQVVCGQCFSCKNGDYHICDELKVMGFQTTGMASEYFAVDSNKVLKLPDDMSFDVAAMVEPIAVASHALSRGGSVKGKKVLVLGAGTIGNLVAQVAKARGAKSVMITDLSDFRLDLAKQCGIDFWINPTKVDLSHAIKDYFGEDKADLILECVGVNPTMDQAITNARKGTSIIVVGVFGQKAMVDLGIVQDRELSLIGTLMYKHEDYLNAIEMINDSKVNPEPLITTHFSFKDYIKAYEFIDNKKDKAVKVIIDVSE